MPGRRQLDPTRPAFEELFAECLFEAGNAVTDGRGRNVKHLACRLERAKARGEIERLQREKVPRRKLAVGQNASAGMDITVAAPALI